jgi:predicted  nucleic acid-binding Zn-ribbon protein
MKTAVQRYEELKSQADQLKQQISRAEGALEQHMTRLKKEFGCSTLADAKRKLKELETAAEEASEAFDTAAAEFQEEWGDKLE